MAGMVVSASAQKTKIGYANVELIMVYMPEVAKANRSLETYGNQLKKNIRVKSDYYQVRLNEYYEKNQSNGFANAAAKKALESELMKLEQEVQRMTSESEIKLQQKQQELMNPIMIQIQGKIDEVAREGNFTYILNQTTGMNILYGLETMNITEELAAKLGVTIPKNW